MTLFDQAACSPAGAGEIADAFGRHIIRLTAAQTGGRLGCFEAEIPAGEGPPLHIHDDAEEFFRVLDGQFAFWCAGAQVRLSEGGVICIPRGAVHRFRNIGETTGRLMVVMTPGGFEGFFPAVAHEVAPSADRIAAIGAQFGLRFVVDTVAAA